MEANERAGAGQRIVRRLKESSADMSEKLILILIGASLAFGIGAIIALCWVGGHLESWRSSWENKQR